MLNRIRACLAVALSAIWSVLVIVVLFDTALTVPRAPQQTAESQNNSGSPDQNEGHRDTKVMTESFIGLSPLAWQAIGSVIGALVSFALFCVAVLQWLTYTRQEAIQGRQLRLIELNYKQWLSVSRFTCEYGVPFRARMIASLIDIGAPAPNEWCVSFRIANKTNWKFEAVRIELGINSTFTNQEWIRQTVGPQSYTTVQVRVQDTSVKRSDKAQDDSFTDAYTKLHEMWVTVVGRVHFINALTAPDVRTFGRTGPIEDGKRTELFELQGDLEPYLAVMDEQLAKQTKSAK